MEKRSNCQHVQHLGFAGLGELWAKSSLNGSHQDGPPCLVEDAHCHICKVTGPNLWLCLHSKCALVTCGEAHKDHSTDHYQDETDHCLHLNLHTFRIWCYKCGLEVYPLNNDPMISQNLKTLFSRDLILTPCETNNIMKLHDTQLGMVGLQNLGNTCYMNSALQALSNVPPMTQFFLECMPLNDRSTKENKRPSLSKAYRTLIQNMWSDDPPSSIAPTSVLFAVKLVFQMFRGFQQHDSQEFLRCFMDQLHEELKEPLVEVKEMEEVTKSEEAEQDSEHSESESFETCDSGVSDDEGSVKSDSSQPLLSSTNSQRTRSLSDSEFSDALDRSPTPRNPPDGTSSATKFRSIVSDVFDGQILSSVECLTCNLISNRMETFQDLSLPIPSRDQLHVIHQSVAQTPNQTDEQGWIYWMWNTVWSWLWGPSGRLNDCLSAFFSADELKGDNMYSCEKCKKLRNGVKFSSIVELPEVLTIHLKRFRHEPMFSSKISAHIAFPIRGLDMKPWISRDCTSKVTTYDLVAVIVHHGTAGGGHYTCYALNEPSSQWMEFDDSSVRPVSVETVASCQAYVLFYRKRTTNELDDFRRHINNLAQQELDAQSNGGLLQFYISSQWYCKFRSFAEPGPIHNQDFLCPHGGVQPLKIDHVDDVCFAVSAVVWEALYTRFGGGPACNRLYRCPICQQAQEQMDKRRREELETFLELQKDFQNEKSSVPLYAISMNWFRKWEQFVKNRECPLPGPVDNLPITIMRNGNRILRPSSDFAQLSVALWHLFYSRYGGGPEILIRS